MEISWVFEGTFGDIFGVFWYIKDIIKGIMGGILGNCFDFVAPVAIQSCIALGKAEALFL